MATVPVLDAKGKKAGTLEVRPEVFGVEIRVPLLHQAVTRELGKGLARASRNVPWLEVETPAHVSVYQLLRARRVVFERAGLQALEEALKA